MSLICALRPSGSRILNFDVITDCTMLWNIWSRTRTGLNYCVCAEQSVVQEIQSSPCA